VWVAKKIYFAIFPAAPFRPAYASLAQTALQFKDQLMDSLDNRGLSSATNSFLILYAKKSSQFFLSSPVFLCVATLRYVALCYVATGKVHPKTDHESLERE
jgi:hypothetical protein